MSSRWIAALGVALVLSGLTCVEFKPVLDGLRCAEDGACPPGTACDFLNRLCVEPGTEECTAPPCRDVVVSSNTALFNAVDMLFVIDNSGSMREEQQSLAASFPMLIDVLSDEQAELPSLHIGVISTDVGAGPFEISQCNGSGDNGVLQNAARGTPGCPTPTDPFIRDIKNPDGTRTKNYTGTLDETFACIAELGTDGCGFEQTLESMHRALNGNEANNGFLRDNAVLAILILSDEDDCSAEDNGMFDTSQTTVNDPLGPFGSFRCFEFGVACDGDDNPRAPGARMNCGPRNDSPYMQTVDRYVDFVKSLKPVSDQHIVVGVLIGDATPVVVGTNPENNNPRLDPSCITKSGESVPGVRLQYFADQFVLSTSGSICAADLTSPFSEFVGLARQSLGGRCFVRAVRDFDFDMPGLQPNCVAEHIVPGSTDVMPVPACSDVADPDSSAELPCYVILDNPGCPTSLAFEVFPENLEPPDSFVELRCATAE